MQLLCPRAHNRNMQQGEADVALPCRAHRCVLGCAVPAVSAGVWSRMLAGQVGSVVTALLVARMLTMRLGSSGTTGTEAWSTLGWASCFRGVPQGVCP